MGKEKMPYNRFVNPIWKESYSPIQVLGESKYFRIRLDGADGEIIYSGKIYKKPDDSDDLSIYLNDICKDYIPVTRPPYNNPGFLASGERGFLVESSDDGVTWAQQDGFAFYWDWSYDKNFNPVTNGLSFPITDDIPGQDSLMGFYTTILNPGTTDLIAYLEDGTAQTIHITGGGGGTSVSGDFNDDFNDDFQHTRSAGGTRGDVAIFLPGNTKRVEIAGHTYNVVKCGLWSVHYRNAHGGLDSFVFKGNCKCIDNYTRHTYKSGRANTNFFPGDTINHINEIGRVYELNTGWLSEFSASRMHHLIGSTQVTLNLGSQYDEFPVIIEDTECEYKTINGEGRKAINYTIRVRVALDMERR